MLTNLERIQILLKGEKGQGLAEYALILVLISIAAILVMTTMGTTITGVFQQIIDALT
ncbi:MAG: Flp family type IVb pilin [Acidaminococcaceae bacterium]